MMIWGTHEERGAYAARGGFAHERQVEREFNQWQQSTLAKSWLQIMKFDLNEIKEVKAGEVSRWY